MEEFIHPSPLARSFNPCAFPFSALNLYFLPSTVEAGRLLKSKGSWMEKFGVYWRNLPCISIEYAMFRSSSANRMS